MKFAMARRNEITLVAALTLLGAALRVFQLGASSLWLDELFSVFVARRDVAQVIAGTAQGDTNPPLFNLLLHFALMVRDDEIGARSLSLIFSVIAIPLLYALARGWFDPRVGLVSALFLAINPYHLFYAQEARMYALLACAALAAMFFFAHAWRTNHARAWLGFAIAMTCAFYTHSLAFLNLLALDVFALTQRAQWRACWRGWLSAHLALALAFAPWLAFLFDQWTRVQTGFWVSAPSPSVLLATIFLFLFGTALPAFVLPFAFFGALVWLGLALIAAIRAERHRIGLQFASIVLSAPLALLYAISFARSVYIERVIIPASFGLIVLLAWATVHAKPVILQRALAALVFCAMFAAWLNYSWDADQRKPPMRDAARALAARFQPGDAIAHTSDSSALAFAYYAPELPNDFLAGDPDYLAATTRGQSGRIAGLAPKNLQAVIAQRARVWLIVALDHNVEYQISRVRELDGLLTRATRETVGGIDILLFEARR